MLYLCTQNMRRLFLYILFVVATVVSHAAVYTPQDVPNPQLNWQASYVANPDAILADSTVRWLNSCAAMLNEKTHVEMATVALQSIGEADAFDFAYELFQRWGIGRKGQNTGVLILFVRDSRDLRIMTGTGIEGVLTDAKCSQIMHDEMFPAFRAGDYDAGICRGALAIYEVCTDGEAPEELLTIQSVTNRGRYADEDGGWTTEEKIVCWGIGIMVLLSIIVFYFKAVKKCPRCKKRKATAIKHHTIVAATYSHSGEEDVTYRCKHCGHTFVVREAIPKLDDSSSYSGGGGGSFSSGGGGWGGGSTSGGGAGGKW